MLKIIKPTKHLDDRGFFSELYNRSRYEEFGIFDEFVQDNHSLSDAAYTIRGLHFQYPDFAQSKLVRCGRGAIFDVAVDIRAGSPTFGKWEGHKLSPENGVQLYVPVGFAHGFMSLEPHSEILYKCSNYYAPNSQGIVRWDSCGINWPTFSDIILSEKDKIAPKLENFNSPFVYGVNS